MWEKEKRKKGLLRVRRRTEKKQKTVLPTAFKAENSHFFLAAYSSYFYLTASNRVHNVCKAVFTQVKFFNGYPSNYICKFACVASLVYNFVLILKFTI